MVAVPANSRCDVLVAGEGRLIRCLLLVLLLLLSVAAVRLVLVVRRVVQVPRLLMTLGEVVKESDAATAPPDHVCRYLVEGVAEARMHPRLNPFVTGRQTQRLHDRVKVR